MSRDRSSNIIEIRFNISICVVYLFLLKPNNSIKFYPIYLWVSYIMTIKVFYGTTKLSCIFI